jgi:hypothetical protein
MAVFTVYCLLSIVYWQQLALGIFHGVVQKTAPML